MHFIEVMASYVDNSMGATGWAVIRAAEADRLIDSSRLISRLSRAEHRIVDGPILREEQHWLSSSRHRAPTEEIPMPTHSRFVKPVSIHNARSQSQSVRTAGLYTSTPARSGNGMWEIYLDLFPSTVPPRPWFVWALNVLEDGVAEIVSADDWTTFVETYGIEVNGMLYPDWDAASDQFSGVHLTARAIAATQGFSFQTRRGLTAPGFWDVEQTLWLRWAFQSPRLLRRYT